MLLSQSDIIAIYIIVENGGLNFIDHSNIVMVSAGLSGTPKLIVGVCCCVGAVKCTNKGKG